MSSVALCFKIFETQSHRGHERGAVLGSNLGCVLLICSIMTIDINGFKACVAIDGKRVAFGKGNSFWQERPHKERFSFYFPDFFITNEKPWLICDEVETYSRPALFQKKRPSSYGNWVLSEQKDYINQFLRLKELISKRILDKGVPYTFATREGGLKGLEIKQAVSSLMGCMDPIYPYGFWDENGGILGGTPETLFRMQSGVVITEALAGTCPKGESFTRCKEKEEHRWVIEGIQDALSPFGSVEVGNTGVVHLSKLSHLHTPITLRAASSHSFDELVRALHPTPALGAYPKKEGMEWLKSYPMDRGRYGAPVGYYYQEKGSCYVGIRNVQWTKQMAQIGLGGGVTAESDFQEEWNELLLKLESVRALLCL